MVGAGTTVAGSTRMVKSVSLTSEATRTPPVPSPSALMRPRVVARSGTVHEKTPSLASFGAMTVGQVDPPSADKERRTEPMLLPPVDQKMFTCVPASRVCPPLGWTTKIDGADVPPPPPPPPPPPAATGQAVVESGVKVTV